MTVTLVIKPRETLSDGRTNVYLSLRAPKSSNPSLRKTGKRVFFHEWDRAARQVKGHVPNAQLLNNFLREQLQRVESVILALQRENLPLSYQSVWGRYTGQTEGTSLNTYTQRKINELKPQVATKTYEDYRGSIARILAYQSHVRFEDITEHWLREYEAFQRQKGRKPNGIFRDMSVLRKFFNLARQEGLIKNYPFSGYQLPKEETIREFLMPAELDALDTFFVEQGTDASGRGPHKTLGFYLFSCYTGLTHDDLLKRLNWQWLEEKLIIRRGKTKRKGKLTTIPLISRAKRLITT